MKISDTRGFLLLWSQCSLVCMSNGTNVVFWMKMTSEVEKEKAGEMYWDERLVQIMIQVTRNTSQQLCNDLTSVVSRVNKSPPKDKTHAFLTEVLSTDSRDIDKVLKTAHVATEHVTQMLWRTKIK